MSRPPEPTARHERQEPQTPPDSGISLQTLVIASLSSVVAAVIINQVWRPGTIIAAAMTPVIVTITQEVLKRPAQTVTAVREKAAVVTPAAARVADRRRGATTPPPPPAPPREDPFGLWEQPRPSRRRRNIGLALAAGLVAFVVGAFALTSVEAVFGGAFGGNDDRFTYWGGSDRDASPSREDAEDGGTSTTEPDAGGDATTPDAQPTPSTGDQAPDTPTTDDPAEPPATTPTTPAAPGGAGGQQAPAQPQPQPQPEAQPEPAPATPPAQP